jgi:hypothetical protein
MRKHLKRPSPAMGVALIALFIALGGTTYAATGGNFILGRPNTATTPTSLTAPVAGGKVLQLTNTSTAAGAEGLGITVGANKAPIRVNSTAGKAANLNADKLDGLDSTSFLRSGQPVYGAATAGNGVQGSSSDPIASGVYGENTGSGGYGVAGRAGPGGVAVYGDNPGGGWAGFFTGDIHVDGLLDCSGCVGAAALAPGAGNRVGGYQLVSATAPDDGVVRTERSFLVSCPLGKMALGGGGWVSPHPLATTAKAAIVESSPAIYYPPGGGPPEPYGWYIKGKAMSDPYNTSIHLGVYAICANVSP